MIDAPTESVDTFQSWLDQLMVLAQSRGMEWAVDSTGLQHRAAFDAGRAPADELQELADMAEWRGCGCGGA